MKGHQSTTLAISLRPALFFSLKQKIEKLFELTFNNSFIVRVIEYQRLLEHDRIIFSRFSKGGLKLLDSKSFPLLFSLKQYFS